jgi:hypothetical protein
MIDQLELDLGTLKAQLDHEQAKYREVLESSHKRLVEFRENLANISDKHAKDMEVKDQEIEALKQSVEEKDTTYKIAQT